MIEDDWDGERDFTEEEMRGSPPGPGFTGVRLYRDIEGNLAVMLFQNGHITELEPNDNDHDRPLGFYDLDMNPVRYPTDPAGP